MCLFLHFIIEYYEQRRLHVAACWRCGVKDVRPLFERLLVELRAFRCMQHGQAKFAFAIKLMFQVQKVPTATTYVGECQRKTVRSIH